MLDKTIDYSNKRNNNLYIIEAALEYFIALLFRGAYFAKISTYIGMSDALTGILTAFITLGSSFQAIALFLHNKVPVKRWVTALHLINQLCFAFIYVIPVFNLSKTLKTVIFVILLLIAYLFHNIVNAPKINWYMSFVENDHRGRFTANKEIVSLVGGIIFSYLIGLIIDGYEAKGDMQTAFVIASIMLFILAISHTIILILSQEKPVQHNEKEPLNQVFKSVLSNKNIYKVIGYFVISTIASSIATPFYGTFQNNELGLTLTFIATATMIGSIARVFFAKLFGKLADKTSFIFLTFVSGALVMLSYIFVIFASPANGMVVFLLYYIISSIASSGVDSSSINLIYDEVDVNHRTEAFALKNAIVGVVGFLTTLAISPLVSYIQVNGINLFGIDLYAQQFLSIIATIIKLVSLVYVFYLWKDNFKNIFKKKNA